MKELYTVLPQGAEPGGPGGMVQIKNLQMQRVNTSGILPVTVALSPDRTLAALFNGDGYDLFSTADGKFLRKTTGIQPQARILNVMGTAFSPDGKQLGSYCTLLNGTAAQNVVIRWDPQTGAEVGKIQLAAVGGNTGGLTWWDSHHLLLWNGLMRGAAVVDLSQGNAVREITLPAGGMYGANPAAGQVWKATGTDSLSLTRVDLNQQ